MIDDLCVIDKSSIINRLHLDGVIKAGTVHDGTSQRYFIGIFDFVANGDATRDDRNLHIIGRKLAVDEKIRRVALHCRTECQDNFLHFSFGYPLYQAVDLQIPGPIPSIGEIIPPKT